MMFTVYKEILDRFQELHTDIEHAFDGLLPEALDWSPGGEMNSIGVLVFHLTGAERFWVGDVACQEPSDRDRAAEFRTHGVEAAVLKQRMAEATTYLQKALETLTLADLEAVRTSPRDGRTFTVAWALLHALEHTAMHAGHIQLTRQLWKQLPARS
jgi:uncharacterized damage-inducible protein DinB